MKITEIQKQFLINVQTYNDRFNAVKLGTKPENIHFRFWTFKEIEKSENIKLDWDLSGNLIPFYGDWHNLFCLDTSTNSIISMDDDRKVVYQWINIEEFISSLTNVEEKPSELKDVTCSGSFFENFKNG